MIITLFALITGLVLFLLVCHLIAAAPVDPGEDLLQQHQCRPPSSYEQTPQEWITERAVGDEWRCHCGAGWRVRHCRVWAAWLRATDLDQFGPDSTKEIEA